MKSDLIELTPLANTLPHDHLVTLPGGHVEILMTSTPVKFTSAIDDYHEHYEFLIPLSVFSHFFIEKQAIECRPGQLLIIKPKTRHGISRAMDQASFISVFIEASYLDRLMRDMVGPVTAPFLREQCLMHSEVQHILTTLITEMRDTQLGRDLLVKNLVEQLTIQLIRHYQINQIQEIRPMDKPLTEAQARFQPVLEYMNENLEAKLTIEQLADMTRMNRFHFIRAFKQAFGQSPYDFLTDMRILQAKKLLVHTRLSANEIGIQCGFFSASRFSAAFRQNTGMTPSAYRTKVVSEQRSLDHFVEPAQSSYYAEMSQ